MIISMKKNSFDKIHAPVIKTARKLGLEENFVKVIKGIYKNPQLTPYSMVKD